MIGDITRARTIYLVCGYTDMRKSIDGLRATVESNLHLDTKTRALFLFCGRRCDRIKLLLWEGDGYVLLYKRLEVKRYYQETYFCPECKKNGDKSNLINAPVPEALIPHSMASETVVAHAMYQKYANAVPFYRQEKDWMQTA